MWPYNRHIILLVLPEITCEISEEVATLIAKNCRCRQLSCHLMPPSTETPANIRIHLIFPETSHWPTFLPPIVWVSLYSNLCSGLRKTHFSATECVLAVHGHSRSSKVDNFDTNRKRVCNFLLVRHCDCSLILHRFRDTANC